MPNISRHTQSTAPVYHIRHPRTSQWASCLLRASAISMSYRTPKVVFWVIRTALIALILMATWVSLAWSQADMTDTPPICTPSQAMPSADAASSSYGVLNWVRVDPSSPQVHADISQTRGIPIEQLALCKGYYEIPTLEPIPVQAEISPKRIHGWAQFYQYDSRGIATLCGDVLLRKADLQVRSDAVTIHQDNQTAELLGHVTVLTTDTMLRGQRAFLQFEQNRTELQEADFLLFQQNARGSAKTIITHGSKQTHIEHGYYTTCPPGNNDWSLAGKRIVLDHEKGWGSLQHMRLKLGKMPVFYTPYFTFPLDDQRHSGFLYPEFNSISEPDLALPFYWNLAPNYDWIIKPRKVGGRGTMLESEFRYLHRPGSGLISLGYLPGDQRFNDADRKSAHWEHYGNLDATWRWHSDVSYLSDNDYLNDLGANLSAVGESFLNREWVIEGNKDSWQAQLAVQSYQTIDGAITADDQPYRKLPEARIHHTSNLANDWLEWSNSASYAYLAQPESSVVPYAHRLHWISEFSLPLSGSWYFLTPQTTLQSSYYQLLGTQSTSATRYVPTFSIDGGLFFDRTIPFQHHRWTQTLEPHLFYTYTPFRDQNPLPVFDTTAMTFGFDQLFRANRFSGIDRIGDTHQTTLATTTRFLNENSQELAQLTIGQILYHTDRNVTLPDTLPLTNSQSPIVLRGQTALPAHLTLAGGLTWDSAHNIIEDGNLMLSSVTDINSAWHTSYRYRKAAPSDDRIDQIIFGVRQHLSGFWHIVGSLHFDLEENRTLEQISGFQYEDCCWRADVVYHRRIRSSTDSVDDAANQYSFLMQFELKGLGKLGSRLDELLSENIPGYIRRN